MERYTDDKRIEPQTEESTQIIEDNPITFLNGFRNSSFYINAYRNFFTGKNPASDVTEEEKKVVFEQSEDAKIALVDFAEKNVEFRYNPLYYSPQAVTAIETYVGHVHRMQQALQQGISREEIETLDFQRTSYHVALGHALVIDSLAPNVKLGRVMGRLMLIEQGLTTYNNTREPDVTRIQRGLQ